jgi:Ty3 transposon capsid-like protein
MVRTRSSDKMPDIPIISAPTTSSPSQQEMKRQLHAQMLLTNKASSMSQDALEKAQENSIQIQELNQKIEHMFQLQQEILTRLKSADTSSDAAASHRNHTRRPPIGTGNKVPPTDHILVDNEDTQSTDNNKRPRDTRLFDQGFRVNAPRMDFPSFSGTNMNVIDWVESCEDFFEINQFPEMLKSRMATMYFTDDAREWFRSYRKENTTLPSWHILVQEIKDMFQEILVTNPFVEFRKVMQTGTVAEYIRDFSKAKSKLLSQDMHYDDKFFLMYFLSGLKEEIQNTVTFQNPQTLKDAFIVAKQVELMINSYEKKIKPIVKPFASQLKVYRPTDALDTKITSQPLPLTTTQNAHSKHNSLTIEQKRAMGLCFRCNDKYIPGHKCVPQKLLLLEGDQVYTEEVDYNELTEGFAVPENINPISETNEQAMLSLCTPNCSTIAKTLKFKGKIGKVSISCFDR